jgi:kynurenine formamidase
MGRSKYGTYGVAWTPPDYTVDDRGKIVGGYQPPGVNNWGRWGEDDRIGTLNLLTPERVQHATTLPKRGKVFSLTLPLDSTSPCWPDRPQTCHYVIQSGTDVVCGTPISDIKPGYNWTDDILQMSTQGSSHWDGLAHQPIDDSFYNGFWVGSMTAMSGSDVLGIGRWQASCTGRGVLLDFARHLGVDLVPPGTVFGREELDAICEAQKVEILPGDIIMLRTGAVRDWWTLETREERLNWFYKGWGGLGLSGVEWLYEHEVAAGACDTVGFEVYPHQEPDVNYPLHPRLLVDLGFPIGEMWELDALAEACEEDGAYEFLLVAPPLAIPRGAGSPINPIAIK